MLNLIVVPLMPLVGALTANLNELIRGESAQQHPKMSIGVKTFSLAVAGFAVVWFALLITAIYTSGNISTRAGVEVLMLFLVGFGLTVVFKASRFISDSAQLWIYRLALPIILLSSALVIQFG
ncbi:hypothetical protein HWQ46_04855 [Shewanella sp. D64]|uniref:hypothetical protein n=1 Tax=unclassified Shewanella TaxID=196818 RepID=UPI0022BA2032|nr:MULTISPECIES: hypothetical protein [unclassified Shewanella]MEC4724879.1 hypothetical protein [Shewanella sp. D64]MEC4736328.1 hypothetical protein [Shewanella sp. E94]WBJ97611.1 hypothetical protein HWQ47_11225 [Shewanella sp. MTB7]